MITYQMSDLKMVNNHQTIGSTPPISHYAQSGHYANSLTAYYLAPFHVLLLSLCFINFIKDTDAHVCPQWNYIMCKTELSYDNNDALNRSRNLDELDRTLLNDKYDYIDTAMYNNLNPNNYNLLAMQLNIRSVLAHQHELKQLLQMLEKKNSRIDAVSPCETFLTKNTANMVNIPGYTHIGNFRTKKKGGGVSILLKEGLSYKRREDLDIFQKGFTESIFVEIISKNGKKIILGSMYRPPNTQIEQFSNNLIDIIHKAKNTGSNLIPEIVIGMDHNVDLLKGMQHAPIHKFIEDISNLNLLPTITCPSRITSQSATLIDNIYVSEQLHQCFESTILLNDMSDHLPLLAMLKQTKLLNKEPLTFQSRCLNSDKLQVANHHLIRKDWIGLLNGTTCNDKFNQFTDLVNQVLDDIGPIKTMRISAKQRYIEPWMTRGLEEASKTKLKLYKKSIQNGSTNEDQCKYKQHWNICNELK